MADNIKNTKELESHLMLFWNGYYDRIGSIFPHRDVPSFQVHPRYHVPSQQDRKTIKNQLSSCDATIDSLESEVSQLQEVTSLLQLRLENYRSYKRFKRSLLTSINNLPDETLSNIFFYTFGGIVDVLEAEPFHPLTKQRFDGCIWDLQLVCVRWRDIILGNPLMWSHFELLPHYSLWKDPKPSLTAVSRRIQSCLKYSRASTLTISITCNVSSVVPISALGDIAYHADRLGSFAIEHKIFLLAIENTEMGALIKKRGLSRLRKLKIISMILDYNTAGSQSPLKVLPGQQCLRTYV
ncbi:hypothetical protein BDQ17DRAFT_1427954 [Cyathus striatus]|nr:hypothetical protein BDQ17DRAFT_1427954 [Cyathus striatus]